jgi:uncharacterized protein (TIGR00730 family)
LRFLEGPKSKGTELVMASRIFREFIQGFRALYEVGPCVTVFGSARYEESHPYYELGRELGAGLARAGFTVMTGGGPGLMEAANRGAQEVGGHSLGSNIQLTHEEQPNPYLDSFVQFKYFFVRKVMLAKYSYAFVSLPGGYGTLDELFEIATLIQTHKMRDFPCVIMGREYYKPLLDFLSGTLVREGAIDQADFDRLIVTDSAEEAVEHIREAAIRKFGLHYVERARQRPNGPV